MISAKEAGAVYNQYVSDIIADIEDEIKSAANRGHVAVNFEVPNENHIKSMSDMLIDHGYTVVIKGNDLVISWEHEIG
jgi:hypothetical protein